MSPRRSGERGVSLVAMAVVALLMGGIALAFLELSLVGNRTTDLARNGMKATYLAEAGCEEGARQIRAAVTNHSPIPVNGTIAIDGRDVAYAIESFGTSWSTPDASGLSGLHQQYRITGEVRYDGALGRVVRVVDFNQVPVFQFLAFYDGDLEIQPGPRATLRGRIHTNGNMHLGSNDMLTVESEYVRAVGEMYRQRKDAPTPMPGGVQVQVTGAAPGTYSSWETAFDSANATWTQEATGRWNGTVQNGAMGVSVKEPPEIASINPGGYFHKEAEANGLVIHDAQVLYQGQNITGRLSARAVTTEVIYDAREGRQVTVTKVNVAELNASGYFPPNGLMYVYRSGAGPGDPQGVMLTNGATLASGLTVVTSGSAYVQGDFNTGGTDPTAKKPAAVIADAVNLLSNAWDGSKSRVSRSLPTASDTTYNVAMITGNQDTVSGAYNGGFENLPRFHENWSGRRARILGSFVSLWESEKATGLWQYGGNRYTAPNREWQFDTDFNDPNKLPPFTPMVTSIERTTYQEGYQN
ncbi:MAG: hypothetical protein HYY16_16020 [Planctomycetes bacterium]|nr:hypothetical protein [Planctomycetota bacterium]